MNLGEGRGIHGQSGKGASSPCDGEQHPNGAAGKGVQGLIRGFVTGVIWGGVVAATGLAVVSQVAPLPVTDTVAEQDMSPEITRLPDAPETIEPVEETAPAPAMDTPDPAEPAGAEADVAVTEEVATEEPSEGASEASEVAPAETLQPEILQKGPAQAAGTGEPDPDAPAVTQEPVAAPVADAPAPAPAPEAEAVVPEDVAAPEETVVEQILAQPGPVDDTAPEAPAAPAAPEADVTVPGALAEAAPGLSGAATPSLPGDEAAPARTDNPPAVEEALLQPAPPEAPAAPALIVPDAPLPTLPGAAPQGQDAEDGLALAVPGVRTDRLPRIGDDAAPAEDGAAPEDAETAVLPEAVLGTTPLELFRRDFDNPDAKPLFAIILIDDGIPAEERARLAALPFAVSFALDPLAPHSADAARIYRDAGQEVVMLASGIPQGATASDLEQTFQALDMAMPEAVAMLDRIEGGFQDTLDLARQAVPIVAEQGRGIITYERGLNSADQVARREGVPRATIFRVLDAEGESIPKMRNYLDRAAFKAAQEGRVLVIGRAQEQTVAAILEWTVEGRAASVALAPVSAVLETAPNP
jgi:uncharacterized protein